MNKRYFPAIIIQKTANETEAILGLEMKSLLKGYLFFEGKKSDPGEDKNALNVNEQRMVVYREGFLQALSGWPENITLELRVTSLPNLCFRAQGRVLITILLRVRAKTDIKARQEILSKYLALWALLNSNMSEAEFAPIINDDELNFHLSPFKPTNAFSVHRRSEKIQLSEPIERKTVTGLCLRNQPKTEADGSFVKYVHTWKPSFDDWSCLIHLLMCQLDPLQLIIRLQPAKIIGSKRKTIEDSIKLCELFLQHGKSYQLSMMRQASLVRNAMCNQLAALSNNAFNIGVFILAPHEIDPSLGNMLGQAITAKILNRDEDSFLYGGFEVSSVNYRKAASSRFFPEKIPFTLGEASCAFRLPSPPMKDIPGLPIRRSRTSLSLLPDLNYQKTDGIDLCLNVHNGLTQSVYLPADDRMRHTFIIGQTGTGKSTMMESMVLQDIRAGHGLAVIDPHGEMVDSILGKIPQRRCDDVILFDILDRERPLGFNLLSWRTVEERDFIIDELYNTIDQIYDLRETGGPMFETNLRGMLRLLMGSKPRTDYKPTILEFRDCYLYKEFRDWLFRDNDDEVTRDFIRELERTGGEASINNMSAYVTSKFGRFVHDTTLTNIIGQDETALDFEDIMDTGKILLVKLGKGRFGPSVSSLLANQFVSRFKNAAMKRGEMRPEERRDFYLYVDECHNLPASNFVELLSEARKYRMGLILATQYAKQLKGLSPQNDLLSAILGNVGCITIFRLGQEDAKLLATTLFPYFSAIDIIGLPNWQGYCRLQIRNREVAPFSFESIKDETPYNHKTAKQVRDLSRYVYGCKVENINHEIMRRRNIWKAEDNCHKI